MLPFVFLVTLAFRKPCPGDTVRTLEDVQKYFPSDFVVIGGKFPNLNLNENRNDVHNPGGAAGNALASRLTENPLFNVLVLEANPSYVHAFADLAKLLCLDNPGMRVCWILYHHRIVPSTPWYWNYTTLPIKQLNNRSIVYPRGHILGGSSSVNEPFFESNNDPGHHDYSVRLHGLQSGFIRRLGSICVHFWR